MTEGQSSNTTFHSVPNVAKEAHVPNQTLHNWIKAGRVTHTYDVDGRAVFTDEERDKVVRFADERRKLRSKLDSQTT